MDLCVSIREITLTEINAEQLFNNQEPENTEPDGLKIQNAVKDIAYFLRNHKFNEWDRRQYKSRPAQHSVGFYEAFPVPSLSSFHWKVQKHCYENFFKCVSYLHNVINTSPFTRMDDLSPSLTNHLIISNSEVLKNKSNECKKTLLYAEKTGLPFESPEEKFHWRTSASYYMCWYTMKGIPELSMLGESCDNFANCLDTKLGNSHRDPRSDDKLSFACAMYSFCPDPCCPSRHVKSMSECYNDVDNPCHVENFKDSNDLHRQCRFDRKDNRNFEHLIENKWNVSCYCQQKGFTWSSQFRMCVDINECITKQHSCDMKTENCLNLPGNYRCVCKCGYVYNRTNNKCEDDNILPVAVPDGKKCDFVFMEKLTNLLHYFGM